MEITSSAETLAQNWKLKIRDWNLNAGLKAGTPLPDGKSVLNRNAHGFFDHGTNFGRLGEQKFRMAITDVVKKHPNANLLAVFPEEKGDIVWYRFTSEVKADEHDKRAGMYSAQAYFLFEKGEGQKFIDQTKSEPTLPDALLQTQFPIFKSEVKTEEWKELLYLPQDLFFQTMEEQIITIARR